MAKLYGGHTVMSIIDGEVECGAESDAKCSILLAFLCGAWFLLWFLLPSLFLRNAFIDILECIVWSRNLQFGYDRNPYFGAWLSHFSYWISGGSIWIFYLLSQLSVLISLFCVWTLARRFLSPVHSFVAVVISMVLLFNGIKTLEFNDDVLEIGLWSLTILFYHKALLEQRVRDWLFVGLFSGLSFMTKYYGMVLFASMALVLLLTVEGRVSFKRTGLYLSAALFWVLALPNVIWLWQNNFVSVFYSLGRANLSGDASRTFSAHFLEPLDCLQKTIPALIPALLVFAVIFHRRSQKLPAASGFNRIFVGVICWGPFFFTLLFSVLTGGDIKYSWLTPVFSLLGLFLVLFWRPFVSRQRLALLLVSLAVFSLICALVFSVESLVLQPCVKRKCPYENFPGKAVANDLSSLWNQRFGSSLKYVIGSREEACNVSVYSKDHPEPFFCANHDYSQWIDEEDLRKSGALIVWKGGPESRPYWYDSLKLDGADVISFPVRNYQRVTYAWIPALFGKTPKLEAISFVFLKPAGKEGQSAPSK